MSSRKLNLIPPRRLALSSQLSEILKHVQASLLRSFYSPFNCYCFSCFPFSFTWSTNGPVKGLQCLRWENNAFVRRKLWRNNYLCADEYPKPTQCKLSLDYGFLWNGALRLCSHFDAKAQSLNTILPGH